jgi:hypothetical protein
LTKLTKGLTKFLTRINLYDSEQTSVIAQTRVPGLAHIFWCDPVSVLVRAIRTGAKSSFNIKVKVKAHHRTGQEGSKRE